MAYTMEYVVRTYGLTEISDTFTVNFLLPSFHAVHVISSYAIGWSSTAAAKPRDPFPSSRFHEFPDFPGFAGNSSCPTSFSDFDQTKGGVSADLLS